MGPICVRRNAIADSGLKDLGWGTGETIWEIVSRNFNVNVSTYFCNHFNVKELVVLGEIESLVRWHLAHSQITCSGFE